MKGKFEAHFKQNIFTSLNKKSPNQSTHNNHRICIGRELIFIAK